MRDGTDEFILRNLIHRVDEIDALDPIEISLVHGVHAQVTGPAVGVGLAPLPDRYGRGTGVLQDRAVEASIAVGAAQVVQERH